MERRKFLKSVGLVTAAAYVGSDLLARDKGSESLTGIEANVLPEFPPLPYAYNALEPYIDARTMEIHYDKHHRAYYTNFVNAVKGTPLENMALADIFASASKQTDVVRNNAGGFFNHSIFWNNLGTGSKGPSPELAAAINKSFGTLDKFREVFNNAAKTRFGSGWAWLFLNSDKNLAVGSTPNQDNPLMDISPVKGAPLLTLDVWEHAYYLKYQNKRADYVDAFWNVVNWDEVNKRYKEAVK
jgi:Fe-Mn family superoxide dismutase